MRIKGWLVMLAALALIAGACAPGDDTEAEPGATAPADGETTPPADGETTPPTDGETTPADGETTADADCAVETDEDVSGGQVTVFGAPTSVEADAIQAVFDECFNEPNGANASYEGSDSFEEQVQIRIEGGNPPDIALFPQPGAVLEQAEAGNAIALEDLGFDIEELTSAFGEYLMSLTEFEGKHYGIPTNANLKSLIWYNVPVFEEQGYEVPETWDDLIALSDQMVEDGFTPWCIGTGSDAATGWPATDWMEDIMLRTAGPDVYDQWVNHEIPFNDEAVVTAAETFGEVAFAEGYVLGGTGAIPDIDFRDAPDPMVGDPPGCLLHRQASFIVNFFPEGTEVGTDIDVFQFPEIEPDLDVALIAGELGAVFDDRPEVREFLKVYTSAEAQCLGGSFEGVSRISPHIETSADCYTDETVANSAATIVTAIDAGGARFDASDLMPPEVGSGAFWTAMNEWMRGADLEQVLQQAEDAWPAE